MATGRSKSGFIEANVCLRVAGTSRQDDKTLRGQNRLTEENIDESLRDVRRALLKPTWPARRSGFLERVKAAAIGRNVMKHLSPGQELVRVVRDELTMLLGEENTRWTCPPSRPLSCCSPVYKVLVRRRARPSSPSS